MQKTTFEKQEIHCIRTGGRDASKLANADVPDAIQFGTMSLFSTAEKWTDLCNHFPPNTLLPVWALNDCTF